MSLCYVRDFCHIAMCRQQIVADWLRESERANHRGKQSSVGKPPAHAPQQQPQYRDVNQMSISMDTSNSKSWGGRGAGGGDASMSNSSSGAYSMNSSSGSYHSQYGVASSRQQQQQQQHGGRNNVQPTGNSRGGVIYEGDDECGDYEDEGFEEYGGTGGPTPTSDSGRRYDGGFGRDNNYDRDRYSGSGGYDSKQGESKVSGRGFSGGYGRK